MPKITITEENSNNNRIFTASCGCEVTSGAGAYGTRGSAESFTPCSFEHEEGIPNDELADPGGSHRFRKDPII